MTPIRTVPSPSDTPLARLLRVYDAAIAACRAHDTRTAVRHLATLRAAHPCDTPSALGIDALYAWCEQAVHSGDFLGAVRTLDGLRSAWQAADRLTTPGLGVEGREAGQTHEYHRSPRAVRP